MRLGLSYDLKEAVHFEPVHAEDALEEYDSLETVGAIAGVLEALGHVAVRLGGGREFLAHVLQEKVDLVFNIAEGRGNYKSREAQVPAVLEMLDIPYSGSDPQCLAICLDKPLTKKLVAMAGVRTPRWVTLASERELREVAWEGFPFPAFVKPAHEGSSMGIRLGSRVESAKHLMEVVGTLMERYQQPVLVEEFIAGDEVTVGVVGNSPPAIVGMMRILPRKKGAYFIYSLEVKRDWERLVDYECPARLEPAVLKAISDSSLKAFQVLGCRDFARIDFRLGSDMTPFFLEINPLPGLNPRTGDLPIMAGKMGWSYQSLISAILSAALGRYPRCAHG